MILPTLLPLLLVATTAAQNIALNKPALQSSIGANGLAGRAVDGDNNGIWYGNTCTHTNIRDTKEGAWWAVDLGAMYSVSSVAITNRKDCCSDRLSNFQIGLTTTNPETEAPVVGQYEACATQGPAMGAGERKSFDCNSIGRYLVVQLKGINALTLCEVEAYGAPVETTCVKQRAQFAQNKLGVEPQFEEGSCVLLPKQCDAEKCYCVSAKNGKRAFKNQEVPLGDDYDCKKKPKKCLKKVLALKLKGLDKASNVPSCTKKGQFEPKQCDNAGACWCASKKGKEIKKTRNADGSLVNCSAP